MLDQAAKAEIAKKALHIRRHIVSMVSEAKSGHPGGSLSAVEVLATLYFHEMNIDPKNPQDPDRDRFVLSKGHASPLLYGTLAEKGFFPVEDLKGFRKINHHLQGHPAKGKTPGVEISTGSLGQGISTAVGMALAAKLDGRPSRVYALLGDGEIQEGQVWEAAMAAAHYKLDNLVAIVDFNGLQIDGPVDQIMSPLPIDKKFEAFGWKVLVIDGHDIDQIAQAFEQARNHQGQPTCIIAKTVKGRGVSYMENQVGWHGTAPKPDQLEQALKELV